MNKIFAGVNVGSKNIVFGVVLFLVLGVVAGVPLTVDLFGGSMLTESQYQTWKVLHAYGVFTALVNFFFGFLVDRMSMDRQQLEIASWSFLVAENRRRHRTTTPVPSLRSRVYGQLRCLAHRDGGICRWNNYICSQPDAGTCGLTARRRQRAEQDLRDAQTVVS